MIFISALVKSDPTTLVRSDEHRYTIQSHCWNKNWHSKATWDKLTLVLVQFIVQLGKHIWALEYHAHLAYLLATFSASLQIRKSKAMTNLRIGAYLISLAAILFYFLFPDPELAVPGALILQTFAFITVGGQSLADSLLLVGISLILIGYLPSDHTLVAGSSNFEQVRWPLLLSGAGLSISMLIIIIYKIRKNINLTNKVFHPRPK